MNPPPTLGILGAPLRPLAGTVFRASRLSDFERHAGALADAPSAVGHAAAAAFMGGVARVALAPVEGFGDATAVTSAARALLDGGATCLVAPGLGDLTVQRALVETFERWRDGEDAPEHARDVTLWLDPPGRVVTDVLERRDALGGDRRAIWLVTPAVRALGPGRSRPDRVPPSAVVAPLAMGTAPALGALVSLEDDYTSADRTALGDAGGIGVLVPRGPRRLVGLAASPPRVPEVPSSPTAEGGPSDPIERAIHEATARITEGVIATDAVAPRLEREARAALRAFAAAGAISAFAVRYEEGQLLVWYRTPTRVREVKVVTQSVD